MHDSRVKAAFTIIQLSLSALVDISEFRDCRDSIGFSGEFKTDYNKQYSTARRLFVKVENFRDFMKSLSIGSLFI